MITNNLATTIRNTTNEALGQALRDLLEADVNFFDTLSKPQMRGALIAMREVDRMVCENECKAEL